MDEDFWKNHICAKKEVTVQYYCTVTSFFNFFWPRPKISNFRTRTKKEKIYVECHL